MPPHQSEKSVMGISGVATALEDGSLKYRASHPRLEKAHPRGSFFFISRARSHGHYRIPEVEKDPWSC